MHGQNHIKYRQLVKILAVFDVLTRPYVTMTQILNSVLARKFHTQFSALHRSVPTSAICIERFDNQEFTHVLTAICCV